MDIYPKLYWENEKSNAWRDLQAFGLGLPERNIRVQEMIMK